MKRTIAILVTFFFFHSSVFAQWFCEKTAAVSGGGIEDSHGFGDAVIIGIAVVIVLFTLILSIKYLFKPGERNPDHIKNIVKDEGF